MTHSLKKILLIGGHGRVAQLATSRLVSAGLDVTSLIRRPEQVSDIEALGSTPLVRDLTVLSVDDWADILSEFDIAVWSAGNGGRGGEADTYAIDREGALTCIEALEKLDNPPKFLMVSYLGSLDHDIDPEDSFYPYADSKETVDRRLLASNVEFVILAPALLTMEKAGGVDIVANKPKEGYTTSRALVADVIVELAQRTELPKEKILAFVDGSGQLAQFAELPPQ
ncbi:putative sugar epimerase YhfK [Corynebacterium atrinae]|uniref:NAD(P)-binding oxidoreductase n=1 Tax=Corynebacterium atrinae TaxID=1336740 RepID=UPI0025B35B0A|nr:NAD(P)-binding oxidoreductase [Corynebacterium atrinae]WJY63430.1 putative sugar epimerase YhfK [Corynebacterium atrinae]